MTCEAQKRGYVPVRITKDVSGWPVGSEGWLDPATRDKVWNDDCTKHWHHTPGESCERITPMLNAKPGDKVKLQDGSVDTIIEILPGITYSTRGENRSWTSEGYFVADKRAHDFNIVEILPADDLFPVGSVHTTRDGHKATIISTNLVVSPDMMLVLISGEDGDGYTVLYKETGRLFKSADNDHPHDLIPPQTTVTLTIPAHRVAELEEFANALR